MSSDPVGLAGGLNTYAYVDTVGIPPTVNPDTYTYAQGNPVSNIDPSGLWSVSIEAYEGVGGGILFGYDETTKQWFWGGLLGYGLGASATFDTAGRRPGGENNDGYCGSGTTYGDFVGAGANLSRYQYNLADAHAGHDSGTQRSYHDKSVFPDHITIGTGKGFEVGGSAGLEVVGYSSSSSCGCSQ